VINRNSSNYVSDNKDYGPCTSDYCSCSNYELRQQLRQKQEDINNFYEKLRECRLKFDEYVGVLNDEENEMEEIKNNLINRAMEHPITKVVSEFIPFSGPTFT